MDHRISQDPRSVPGCQSTALVGAGAGPFAVAAITAYGGQELGLPVVGVPAGLGVGGLAVALAAQSSIENLIGGLNLYADRPVRVETSATRPASKGTWSISGFGRHAFRALDRTVTSVPNSLLAKVHVTNFALRDQMLFRHSLDLRYETTTDQLRALVNSISAYLKSNPSRSEPDRRAARACRRIWRLVD